MHKPARKQVRIKHLDLAQPVPMQTYMKWNQ